MTPADGPTRIDEIAPGIHRISTAVPPSAFPGGFTFNQFLIVDEAPLLYHTGMIRLFPAVRAAIETVLPLASLRYVSCSHFEADECGALNLFLDAAPQAVPLASMVGARTTVGEYASRPVRGLRDGERIVLGKRAVRWFDAPHVPHGWDCGYLFEETTATLFCGDLFTQPGESHAPLVDAATDILAASESMRARVNYYALSPDTRAILAKLADARPHTLACMHGSAWRGDGAAMLGRLADALQPA